MRIKMTKRQQEAFVEILRVAWEVSTPKQKNRLRKAWLKNRNAK